MSLLALQTAYSLVSSGTLTVGEVARVAGVSRALVAYWCRDIDAHAARASCFAKALARLTLSYPALTEQAVARMVIERGAATPSDFARAKQVPVKRVYAWHKGVDHRAARQEFCAEVWRRALIEREKERARQGLPSDYAYVKRGRTLRRVPV